MSTREVYLTEGGVFFLLQEGPSLTAEVLGHHLGRLLEDFEGRRVLGHGLQQPVQIVCPHVQSRVFCILIQGVRLLVTQAARVGVGLFQV